MSKNKVVKSVSFNITNEKDREYLERIGDANFSGYVKRLIEKDIRSRKIVRSDKPVNTRSNGPIMTKGITTMTLILE